MQVKEALILERFGDPRLFGALWSMVSVMEGENQFLFLGLQGGGIALIQLLNLID